MHDFSSVILHSNIIFVEFRLTSGQQRQKTMQKHSLFALIEGFFICNQHVSEKRLQPWIKEWNQTPSPWSKHWLSVSSHISESLIRRSHWFLRQTRCTLTGATLEFLFAALPWDWTVVRLWDCVLSRDCQRNYEALLWIYFRIVVMTEDIEARLQPAVLAMRLPSVLMEFGLNLI